MPEDEPEPTILESISGEQLVDREIRGKARFAGLTRIDARLTDGLSHNPHIKISRASSSGDYERLTPDEARRMADEIRQLDENDSVLLNYFTGGGRDDPEEMIETLEAAAEALEVRQKLDEETLSDLSHTLFNEVRD